MEEYIMQSVIQVHHVCKSIGYPIQGEQLIFLRREGNSHDRHAVNMMKGSDIVSHIP